MVQGDEGIIYIKLGWYQDIFICRDGTIEGKSYHIDWNDPCEFEEYAHSITLMKNLLFFIENGHNEGTI